MSSRASEQTFRGGDLIPRARQIGLTEDQKARILRSDRLPEKTRRDLRYDVRMILEKEHEDLEFLFSSGTSLIRRDRSYFYVLEAALPQDPKRVYLTLEKIREYRKILEDLELTIQTFGLALMRRPR